MHRADGHAARCKKSCEVPLKFAGAAPKTNSAEGDRKSTRLNSSHGYISYAVFCLKKNKPSPGEPDHPDHIPVTGRPTRQPLPPGHNDQNGAARSAIASVDAESSSVAQSHVSAAT